MLNNKKNKKIIEEKQLEIKNRLIEASMSNLTDLYQKYNSSFNGIKDEEIIKDNQDNYGKNVISKKGADNVFKRLFRSFFNPFNIILFILSMISMVVDVILPLPADKNYITMIIILSMIIISSFIHFHQEQKSASSAHKLIEIIETTSLIERNGVLKEIPLDEIVVGDIVHLAAGDIIPADVRIIQAKDLFVSQSSLTGESEPIEKFANIKEKTDYDNVTDRHNLAFMGSNIISGSAKAIVVVVGNDTYIGQVASKVNEKQVTTSFEKGVRKISIMLTIIMAIIIPIVFVIVGLTNKDIDKSPWINALLFGISIAVGLTPEMLPMIITSCLSKGAIKMGKQKTIVKNINSIQNFGAMDILCTDKTGTLTRDEVILERHLDVLGKEDTYVLKYAFLNSYYQTGLKNLLDKSIINRTLELADDIKELDNLELHFEKIDEVPFDFNRKRMSVLVRSLKNNRIKMITKGAVEEIISVCSTIYLDGKVVPLDKKMIKKVLNKVEEFSEEGMRVIAIASKNDAAPVGQFSVADERDMTLIGYLTFLDPPKDSARDAIEKLHSYGVEVKILTGDNPLVTKAVCAQVGIPYEKILLGKDIMNMSDADLAIEVENTQIFAKLSPDQKARIINILRKNGHVVGYMGDGINDAPAMKVADVSISVDTAVDIAKETANIILLEKDLNVLATGIVEGRKTHANINKYVKMTVASNFGNVISVVLAALLLPFLPMMPVQIIFLNLIYDLCCGTLPWDNVDSEFIKKPRKWEHKSIFRFMFWFGPISSIVDILTFVILFYVMIPQQFNGQSFSQLTNPADILHFKQMFWTGWLVASMFTQSLIIHFIRTNKIPFIQSNASTAVIISTLLGTAIVTASAYIPKVNSWLSLTPLPAIYFAWLLLFLGIYIILTMITKLIYKKIYKEFL
ncbi:Magnesium-transporting ATPase, P-type 1 [Metamycoplasma cloacale]|uniref:Magnesium-transporting ATPase, P-type 1 n=1 Tax=Metamycoplasma cloacale TaxID=92401 RepID=A0A2Z4LMI1_9BACT|nr:magnesium-translocating P-type ATPase [Metamycoplasma cloacale]AWX42946.1 magnesium-translocating P-type ATPase [Metamycoplasma cloacale]VEU79230.1 Magnesium-transporting ATPase, P-type 1 [Metamycoplasma cloacale]